MKQYTIITTYMKDRLGDMEPHRKRFHIFKIIFKMSEKTL